MNVSIEDLKLLEAICPFSAEDGDIKEYTPEIFEKLENKDYKPVFKLQLFTIGEYDKVPNSGGALEKMTTAEISELARKRVKGWENLRYLKDGSQAVFKPDEKGNPIKEVWGKVPFAIQGNILHHAIKCSGLLHGERLGLV